MRAPYRKGSTIMKNNKLFISISLILFATISSLGFAQGSVSHESIVRQYIVEFWNRGNVEAADKLLVSEATLLSPDGIFEGLEAIKSLHNNYTEAFSDLSFVIDKISINDNGVEVGWILKGTHDGEILGIAPTWNVIKLRGTSVYTLAENKIVKEVKEYDQIDLLEQLGVVLEASDTEDVFAEQTRTRGPNRYRR